MQPPPAARLLGYAGLTPFFIASLIAMFGGPDIAPLGRLSLLLYGGVILSFMGGCRWGFAAAGLGDGPSFKALGASVLPALLGFFVLLAAVSGNRWLDFSTAAVFLAIGFAALFLADRASTQTGGAPAWWSALRAPLSAGACCSLCLPALA